MKFLFYVHSHISYLSALSVITEKLLCLDDVYILSEDYKRESPVEVINFDSLLAQSGLYFSLKKKMLPQYEIDEVIEKLIGGEEFELYLAWPMLYCKFLMIHPHCTSFHFIEEGLSAYWNNMSLKEILFQRNPRQNVKSTLSFAGIIERLKDAITVFRGINTAIQYIPQLYFQYISDESIHYYGFSDDSFCLVQRNKHVMDMVKNLKSYSFEGTPVFNNSVFYVSDYNQSSHLSYEEYLQELNKLSKYLTKHNIAKLNVKWHYRCNDVIKVKLTSYLKSIYFGEITFIATDVILEMVFINSQDLIVLGCYSSLLFYAAILGHKAYSFCEEENDNFSMYWKKVKRLNS